MSARERGLYKNGNRWWIRVRAPGGIVAPRSTGTQNLGEANQVARTLRKIRQRPHMAVWLTRAAAGEISLLELDRLYRGGELYRLRESKVEPVQDLSPMVERWLSHVLPGRREDKLARDYHRQIRALIPSGAPFPASKFTEARIARVLQSLSSGATTKRVYFNTWRRFFLWARRRVTIDGDPFADVVPPRRSPSRTVYWDYETVQRVLSTVPCSEKRRALALVFGSGIELSALIRLRAGHVQNERTRCLLVHGTKTQSRMDRAVFVDQWAWNEVHPAFQDKPPTAPVFGPSVVGSSGRSLREALYEAQVKCGLVDEPPLSERTSKPMWGSVEGLHSLHDARHSYAINRLLGLDGEPAQSMKFVAYNLGHTDEQMVIRIYAKARVEDRLRLIGLSERSTPRPAPAETPYA